MCIYMYIYIYIHIYIYIYTHIYTYIYTRRIKCTAEGPRGSGGRRRGRVKGGGLANRLSPSD